MSHELETQRRKREIIRELGKLNVTSTVDGRPLDTCRLATLEWTLVVAKSEFAKAYGER